MNLTLSRLCVQRILLFLLPKSFSPVFPVDVGHLAFSVPVCISSYSYRHHISSGGGVWGGGGGGGVVVVVVTSLQIESDVGKRRT